MLRWLAPVGFGVLLAVSTLVARADQSDPRLDALFLQLKSESEPARLQATEATIWRIWLEVPSENPTKDQLDQLMERGRVLMATQRYEEASALFSEVIRLSPTFAEAWNKRATVNYLRQDFAASVSDISRTLELEPRHFGAISGLGLILMRRNDHGGALEAFKRVLAIHPNARGALMHVEMLNRLLRGQAV